MSNFWGKIIMETAKKIIWKLNAFFFFFLFSKTPTTSTQHTTQLRTPSTQTKYKLLNCNMMAKNQLCWGTDGYLSENEALGSLKQKIHHFFCRKYQHSINKS